MTLRTDAAAVLAEVQLPYDAMYGLMPIHNEDGIEHALPTNDSREASYRHLTHLHARARHLVHVVNRKRISATNLAWAVNEVDYIRADLHGDADAQARCAAVYKSIMNI